MRRIPDFAVPAWLSHSFEIMGGILPALGFAITLTVIGKKTLIPFFRPAPIFMAFDISPVISPTKTAMVTGCSNADESV